MEWIEELLGAVPAAAKYRAELEHVARENARLHRENAELKDELVQYREQWETLDVVPGLTSPGALYSTTAWVASHEKEVQGLTNAIVNTLAWIHAHSPEDIMAKMPPEIVGKNKELYLAALKNTIPMYSQTGKMDPKGADAVLAMFSVGSPEVAKAGIDVSKTFTNKYVEQAARTAGVNVK